MTSVFILLIATAALVSALTAIILYKTDRYETIRMTNARRREIDEHRRKLAGWVYHFSASAILIGVFFLLFWFFHLQEALMTHSLIDSMALAPPVAIFLAVVSCGYLCVFLGSVYWHAYSISRAYRPHGEKRTRDRFKQYLHQYFVEERVLAPQFPRMNPDTAGTDDSAHYESGDKKKAA